jgi:predicted amidophosphoribosyltransferase
MRARAGSSEVMLIDDVITTGSTLNEARQVLEKAGYFVTGFITFAETEANRSMLSTQATVA